jgi:hypothetical protein
LAAKAETVVTGNNGREVPGSDRKTLDRLQRILCAELVGAIDYQYVVTARLWKFSAIMSTASLSGKASLPAKYSTAPPKLSRASSDTRFSKVVLPSRQAQPPRLCFPGAAAPREGPFARPLDRSSPADQAASTAPSSRASCNPTGSVSGGSFSVLRAADGECCVRERQLAAVLLS